jgi:cell division protein FtsN
MVASVKRQRGGFGLGMVVGLLVGLALALGVALYVTKVPVPFVDKVPQRTQEQDAAETEKNRNWDPNAPLYGKNPAQPKPAASEASGVVSTVPVAPPAPTVVPPPAQAVVAPASAPARAASEAGSKSNDGLRYFVQIGAYARTEDAEQQRAKLAMTGLAAKITEREQSGKVMYRVRLGPFDSQADAEAVKEQAASVGYGEAALVRVAK